MTPTAVLADYRSRGFTVALTAGRLTLRQHVVALKELLAEEGDDNAGPLCEPMWPDARPAWFKPAPLTDAEEAEYAALLAWVGTVSGWYAERLAAEAPGATGYDRHHHLLAMQRLKEATT